jgi:hypothetical protein
MSAWRARDRHAVLRSIEPLRSEAKAAQHQAAPARGVSAKRMKASAMFGRRGDAYNEDATAGT